jgi:hypothetical protein
MAIRVVEFSNGRYKIRKIFAKKSIYPKEIFLILRIGLTGSLSRVFKVDYFNFSCKKIE